MSTVIGSVTLDRDLIFEDEYKWNKINSEVTTTLGGGMIAQEFMKTSGGQSGRLVTLTATDNMGWQTKSTVDDLLTLANANTNSEHTLTITTSGNTFTKTVRFRHEVSGGPVQFEPIISRDGYPSDTMYYKGTIYLMVK